MLSDGEQHPGPQWTPPVPGPFRPLNPPAFSASPQGARCGDGLRYRNVTCFVSDGSGREPGSPVDEGLCGELELGVDGERPVVLEESCAVPCPGEQTGGPPGDTDSAAL